MAACARLPSLAYSVASRAAPDHSPPSPRPWKKRSSVSMAGAHRPIWKYVGSRPMRNVAMPMVSSEPMSVVLRPTRSPRWPKTTAPSGRATNAAPKVAMEASRAVLSSPPAKKISGNTETAAVA